MSKRTIQLEKRKRKRESWHDEIEKRESKAEDLAAKVMADPRLLPQTLGAISSARARTRLKSAKILRIISEKNPKMLCPRVGFFVDLLDSENNILKWIAIDVLANLTPVDSKNRFDEIFRKYYGYLGDESMITAAHVIDSSGKIALAKPRLRSRITTELLRVETIPRGQECKNILLGKVILAFSQYVDQVRKKEKMISSARRQLNNSRNATRRKAEKFLRRFEKR